MAAASLEGVLAAGEAACSLPSRQKAFLPGVEMATYGFRLKQIIFSPQKAALFLLHLKEKQRRQRVAPGAQ